MKKRIVTPACVLSVLVIIVITGGGCKKDPLNNLTNEETRIYTVNYDTTANFSSYKTFNVADSVDVISNNQLLGKSFTGFDSTAIAAVTQAMQQKGYQLVAANATPDLAVTVSRIYSTSTGFFNYADYWDYYDTYWDPYYWGYGGYGFYTPYALGTYSITTGGLEVDLLDLKNASSDGNKIISVWTGLATGEQVFLPTNASAEVNALFAQSPYLK